MNSLADAVIARAGRHLVSSSLGDLLDLVFPKHCVGCGSAGEVWCADCRATLAPVRVPLAGLTVFAAGDYSAGLRRAVLAYKEHGQRGLAPALARCLTEAGWWADEAGGPPPTRTVLVPIPSRRGVAAARGGDHVWRLTRAVSEQSSLPARRVLRLNAAVLDSVGLTAEQRFENLSGQMSAAPPAGVNQRAVLLDDVLTTGATLSEAARALRAAGWEVSHAAVIARTVRRRPPGRHAAQRGVFATPAVLLPAMRLA